MFTLQQAQAALIQHANAVYITAQQVEQLLGSVASTFASIVYVTQVQTAAKHKQVNIQKVTKANVTLFNSAYDYTAAVQRSAGRINDNNSNDVQNFTKQDNYYEHTTCYSVVKHKLHNTLYLYAAYNNAHSYYFIDNVQATKQQVAAYLTPSAAEKLLRDNTVVHNATHNVLHTVHVRTIQLNNIVSITANKQQIVV